MKTIKLQFLFFLIFYFVRISVYSQEVNNLKICDFNAAICTFNLTNPISGLTLKTVTGVSYAKVGTTYYKDVLYHGDPEAGCKSPVSVTTCEDNAPSLVYDVYYPEKKGAQVIEYDCGLPAVIMFHGGNYFECSNRLSDGISTICQDIAKRGFVVFNVEYRRGVLKDANVDPGGFFKYVTAQQILGIYRACQDARGAIRSIIKRESGINPHPSDPYKVDLENIFIGGMSAGAVMAMNVGYYERQSQIDSAYPGASASLGSIDIDYYYGETSIEYRPKIKGVLDMWGNILMHKSFTTNQVNFFNGMQYRPPIIVFQGALDNVFTPDRTKVYFSPYISGANPDLNKEADNCLVSTLDLDDDPASHDAYAIGADRIWGIFHAKGWPVEEYLDCDMKHGLDDDCVGCTYLSDFGTGATTKDDTFNYIAARTSTFFVAILQSIVTSLGRSRFVECENKRVKCNTTDNAPGCTVDENIATCD